MSKCERCGSPAVYIGIGPAAPLCCKFDCEGKCPKCFSPEIEPFVKWSYWGLQPAASTEMMHCIDCGRLFEQDGSLTGYDDDDQG